MLRAGGRGRVVLVGASSISGLPREVIVFPPALPGDPAQFEFDDDLLRVFRVDAGWVFVCETWSG